MGCIVANWLASPLCWVEALFAKIRYHVGPFGGVGLRRIRVGQQVERK